MEAERSIAVHGVNGNSGEYSCPWCEWMQRGVKLSVVIIEAVGSIAARSVNIDYRSTGEF